jgi:hypothetical protein
MNRRIFMYDVGGIIANFSSVCFAQTWRALDRIPSVVVLSPENDARLPAVREAVSFWNTVFSELGSPFRFGEITHVAETVSFDDLRPFSSNNLQEMGSLYQRSTGTFFLPERFRKVNGYVVVALSDGKFDPFAIKSLAPRKYLVAISGDLSIRLKVPNGPMNVIAHELGHVVGLDHNYDSTTLMCGGGWCWFKLPTDGFLPLTSDDKSKLLKMYPPDWRPDPIPDWRPNRG